MACWMAALSDAMLPAIVLICDVSAHNWLSESLRNCVSCDDIEFNVPATLAPCASSASRAPGSDGLLATAAKPDQRLLRPAASESPLGSPKIVSMLDSVALFVESCPCAPRASAAFTSRYCAR